MKREIRSARAFTLVEMLVTIFLLGMLTAMVSVMTLHSRAKARAVKCLTNQKRVSEALLAYYTDKGDFPADGANAGLAIQLAEYTSWPDHLHTVALPEIWRCPNDPSDRLSNSYEPYYVRRKSPTDQDCFLLGCPRHKDTEYAYLNLNGISTPTRLRAGLMQANGEVVENDGSIADRTIDSGNLRFEDGSSAAVVESTDKFGVTAVTSFRCEDGNLYTIVRVEGTGKARFSVNPGARFEVVTPVAIIGVRGTEFTVETQPGYAKIVLESGSVRIEDRTTGQKHELIGSGECEIGVPADEPVTLTATSNSYGWIMSNPNDEDIAVKWVHINAGTGELDLNNQGYATAKADADTYLYLTKKFTVLRIYYTLPNTGDTCYTYSRATDSGYEGE